MKKKIRIITIVLFVIAAIPISIMLAKSNTKELEQYNEARKVESDAAFAEALKTDGWIYAKGSFVGKASLQEFNVTSKTPTFEALFTNENTPYEIAKFLKGDFIYINMVIGRVEREKDDDPFNIFQSYTALSQAENITFLGQPFDAEKIIPMLYRKEKIEYPEKGSSSDGYKLEMIRSPFNTWLKVLVSDGKMVEKEMSLTDDDHMQLVKSAAESGSKSLNNYSIAGFLGVWVILLFIVLWLEGKYIKR